MKSIEKETEWKYDLYNLEYWIGKIISDEKAFVVQIGSNDGKTGDPIHKLLKKRKQWKGLFVEPVPYLFERLQCNYFELERFNCENAVINEGQKAIFYWVDESAKEHLPGLPDWYDQLGSFDKGHILKHLNGVLEPYIISREIQGLTLCDLLKKYQVDKIDIMHIDTEGYDFKILRQLELEKFQPTVILYEHIHLSNEEQKLANDFVSSNYFLFKFAYDMLCVNKSVNKTVQLALSPLMRMTHENNVSP